MGKYYYALAVTCLLILGCSSKVDRSEGFESVDEKNQLPPSWELAAETGTYRAAQMGGAFEGDSALAVAGSGGLARLNGPSMTAKDNKLLLANVWAKSTQIKDARIWIGLSGDKQQPFAKTELDTQTEEWKKYLCVFQLSSEDDTARFYAEIKGEGMFFLDSLHLAVRDIHPDIRLTDYGFEQDLASTQFPNWNLSADAAGAALQPNTESPHQGDSCLRIVNEGKWCVATYEFQLDDYQGTMLLSAFARAKKGRAQLKLEFFEGSKFVGDVPSPQTIGTGWEPLSVHCDAGLFERADTLRVSLAVENSSAKGCVADFDSLNLIAVD